MLLAILTLLASLTTATSGAARVSEGPPPILQPADYASPSGQFVLHVDPSRRDGGGPGAYRMMRDGEPVWEKTLDVTMWKAGVTDDGRVAGFGFTEGFRDYRWEGEFHVLLIDADGRLIADDATKRGGGQLHSPPFPVASQLWIQPELDLFRLIVNERDQSEHTLGRVYRLSTGERLDDWIAKPPVEPDTVSFMSPRGAAALPGTGLMLMRWMLWDGESTDGVDHMGSVYALRNAADETLWSEVRPLDFTVPGDEEASSALLYATWEHEPIIECLPGGRFALWFPAEGVRADFVASERDGAWTVERVDTAPYQPPQDAGPRATPIELPRIAKQRLGRAATQATEELGDVRALRFGSDGALEYVRSTGRHVEFVRRAKDGTLEITGSMDLPEDLGGRPEWYDGGGEAWYLTEQRYRDQPVAPLYRVDAVEAQPRLTGEFRVPRIDRIVSHPQGGVVILGSVPGITQSRAVLLSLDGEGRLRWEQVENPNRVGASELSDPQDVTVTSKGEIVVLNTKRSILQVFGADGAYRKSVDLRQAFSELSNYTLRVLADARGGVWIHRGRRVWNFDLEGSVTGPFATRFANGLQLPLVYLAVDSQSRVWGTDGVYIASVDSNGRAGPRIGAAPASAALQSANDAYVDHLGRVLLSDAEGESWHAFALDGKALFTASLPRGVAADSLERPTVAADGSLWAPVRKRHNYSRHVHFSASGELLGEESFGDAEVLFDAQGDHAWQFEYRRPGPQLERLDAERNVSRELRRRPDGDWWRQFIAFHRSADGTRLVVVDGPGNGGSNAPPLLAVFDGEGNAWKQIELPRRQYWQVSTSADWAVVWGHGSAAVLVHLASGAEHEFELGARGSVRWNFSPDGKELWAVDIGAMTLHRFALPER